MDKQAYEEGFNSVIEKSAARGDQLAKLLASNVGSARLDPVISSIKAITDGRRWAPAADRLRASRALGLDQAQRGSLSPAAVRRFTGAEASELFGMRSTPRSGYYSPQTTPKIQKFLEQIKSLRRHNMAPNEVLQRDRVNAAGQSVQSRILGQ